MNKKVKIGIAAGVVVVILLALVAAPKLLTSPSEIAGGMVTNNFFQWRTLQLECVEKKSRACSNEEMGWTGYSDENKLNEKCKEKTKCFSFYGNYIPGMQATVLFGQEITPAIEGEASFSVKNNEDIGKCKAGNSWEIRVYDDGKYKRFEPKDKACLGLVVLPSL